jgi:hypothetical protein
VVPKIGRNTPPPPVKLGKDGQNLWDRIQVEYAVTDAGGIELLFQACSAADRAATLAAQVDRDGAMISSRQGSRAHPCLRDELANRAFCVRTLTRLGVTLEPVKPMGRPPMGGWNGADDA